jgi:mannitol/fructose-specific phosphotransferase system IIA component (Ntr-type)
MLARQLNSASKTLADFTDPELLVSQLQSPTANSALIELCSLLHRKGRLDNSTTFYDAVLAREALSATCFLPGWAFPHARLKELPELCFALARTAQPVKWIGDAQALVQTIFLFAVPEHAGKAYLELVSAIARLSQNRELCATLNRAPDADSIFRVLQQVSFYKPQAAAPGARAFSAGVAFNV